MNSQRTYDSGEILRRHGYSDRPEGLRPVPLALSFGIVASMMAAYAFAPPEVLEKLPGYDPIIAKPIPLPEPPPMTDPIVKPEVDPLIPETTIVVPNPPMPIPSQGPKVGTTQSNAANTDFTSAPVGTGKKPVVIPVAPPLPVLTAISIDPRFADRFQPDYPPVMLRRGEEGTARVRVLVGSNGRVKQVVDAGSSDSAFFRATQRHAMKAWRFKPATRNGVAFESWHEMTVTFTLTD